LRPQGNFSNSSLNYHQQSISHSTVAPIMPPGRLRGTAHSGVM
jgi:hypothetical protein